MAHRYLMTVSNTEDSISMLENYLKERGLITQIENYSADMTSRSVSIIVKVPNKDKFERWYNPRKRIREHTDPIWLVQGTPLKLDRGQESFRKETKKPKAKTEEFNKMKSKFDYRK
ncbi:hypothetical protein K0B04_01245 [Patescibacteria group bacterium]|nr:hypothetical protein [Patescibacteria group bacterium]